LGRAIRCEAHQKYLIFSLGLNEGRHVNIFIWPDLFSGAILNCTIQWGGMACQLRGQMGVIVTRPNFCWWRLGLLGAVVSPALEMVWSERAG